MSSFYLLKLRNYFVRTCASQLGCAIVFNNEDFSLHDATWRTNDLLLSIFVVNLLQMKLRFTSDHWSGIEQLMTWTCASISSYLYVLGTPDRLATKQHLKMAVGGSWAAGRAPTASPNTIHTVSVFVRMCLWTQRLPELLEGHVTLSSPLSLTS